MKRRERKAVALLGENLIWNLKKGERLASEDEVIFTNVKFFCKFHDFIRLKYRRFLLVISNLDDYKMLFHANQIRETRKRIRFEIFCYNRELFESLQLQYPLYPPIHPKDKITYLTECEEGGELQAEFQTYLLNHATTLFCVYDPKQISPRLQSIIGQAKVLNKQVVFQPCNPWKEYMEEIKDKTTPFPNF